MTRARGTRDDASSPDDAAGEIVLALAAREAGASAPTGTVAETSSGALVAFAGDVVVKLHVTTTDPRALGVRLRLAGDAAWQDCLIAPLRPEPVLVPIPGAPSRWASFWPRVDVVRRDPEDAPWATAGRLLARLHLRRPPASLPAHGAVDRLRRVLRDLGETERIPPAHRRARDVVIAAGAALPPGARTTRGEGQPLTVVHGDWHLGQLGRLRRHLDAAHRGLIGHPDAQQGWRLIDIDDLGLGDPAWDFERVAAMWAIGILPDGEWEALLDAYLSAGGPALPAADPWSPLDPVARAGVVQAAAGAVRRAVGENRDLDDVDMLLIEGCERIGRDPVPDRQDEKNRRPKPPRR
jgi:hypothetical protein